MKVWYHDKTLASGNQKEQLRRNIVAVNARDKIKETVIILDYQIEKDLKALTNVRDLLCNKTTNGMSKVDFVGLVRCLEVVTDWFEGKAL